MDRGRSADERRTDTGRLRGEHTAELRSARQAARRGEAHLSAATPTTTESFQLFLNQASRYPLLTREEEVELAQRIERGDLEAKERLINSNLRLVVKFALRYAGHGLSREDLVQEAMLGLIRAAEKFDWRRGYKFSTYAVLWIKQAVQRGLDNTGRGVRIPAHIAQRERNVARAEADLRATLDREPTDEEVAEHAKLPLDEVLAVRDLTRVTTSLDAPIGDGDTSLGELHAESATNLEDEVLEREQEETVAAALARLTDEERSVIESRFGTGGREARSVRDTARKLGLTQSSTRELEERALARLARDGALAAFRSAA
jgi:RNA polymerase primary sigma factor